MPIYNFIMCVSAMDFKFIISNLNKISDEKAEEFVLKNEKYILDKLSKIQLEYTELTFGKEELKREKEVLAMRFLEAKRNVIIQIVNTYIETNDKIILAPLTTLCPKIKENDSIAIKLKKARGEAIGLLNKINIGTANFKAKYKITTDEFDSEKDYSTDDIEKNLDAQALSIESNLETGYLIDTRKTSVLRWVNLKEAVKRKSEQLSEI